MKSATINDCLIIILPKINSRAGNISPIHNKIDIPFEIKRIFYLYDIPGGASRGAHSHKECHQFIVAASGSFDIILNDGKTVKSISLNRPFMGLYIPPMIWAEEVNFSSGAICLVLTSHKFDTNDYIRDFTEFIKIKTSS